MFHLLPTNTKIDFVSSRKIWLSISGLFIVATIALWNTKGLNYGIDFEGGAEVEVQIPQGWDIGKLRSELTEGGLKDARVQSIGDARSGQFLIRAAGDETTIAQVAGLVQNTLSKTLKEGSDFKILKSDVVGAAAGSILRKKAFFCCILCASCNLALCHNSI